MITYLQNNKLSKDSLLYIFSDTWETNTYNESKTEVSKVRQYIHKITGFKEIIIHESTTHKGLANSIIYGVTSVIKKHGKAIIIEDDLVTNMYFLQFMNEALNLYKDNHNVFSISGHNHRFHMPLGYTKEIYLAPRIDSWGWATWNDRWSLADWNMCNYNELFSDKKAQERFCIGGKDKLDLLKMQMDGKIDSWAIRWDYTMFLNKSFCLKPYRSLINNIGCDGSGTHYKKTSKYSETYLWKKRRPPKLRKDIEADPSVWHRLQTYMDNTTYNYFPFLIKRKISTYFNLFNLHHLNK